MRSPRSQLRRPVARAWSGGAPPMPEASATLPNGVGIPLHIQCAGLDAAEWPEYRVVRPRFLEPRYRRLPQSTDAGALREVGAVRSLIATLEGTRHDYATALELRRGGLADLSRLHAPPLSALAIHLHLREHRGRNQRSDNASHAARIPHGFLRPRD